jgi:hypothetical protein
MKVNLNYSPLLRYETEKLANNYCAQHGQFLFSTFTKSASNNGNVRILEFVKSIAAFRSMVRSFSSPALLASGLSVRLLQWLDGALDPT